MYAFLDRPVSDLDNGGRFLIWSMRSWVTAMSARSDPQAMLAKAFAHWNVSEALCHFQKMMALFNRAGKETFQFCAIPCNHVSEHEAIILSLVSRRSMDPDGVREAVAMLVERNCIPQVLTALDEIGMVLEIAGIFPATCCVKGSAAS